MGSGVVIHPNLFVQFGGMYIFCSLTELSVLTYFFPYFFTSLLI